MDIKNLLLFAVTLGLATAIPGPDILAVVSSAIGRGFRTAAAIVCGQIISDLFYFNLAVFGLAALAQHLGELFFIIKLAGAAYLIWLDMLEGQGGQAPVFYNLLMIVAAGLVMPGTHDGSARARWWRGAISSAMVGGDECANW